MEAVTPMHGCTMEYLYRNSDTLAIQWTSSGPFITRSTVTNILFMERKGWASPAERGAGRPPAQLVLTGKGRQPTRILMRAFHHR